MNTSSLVVLTPLQEKNFWRKVAKSETCWVWIGATDRAGRGRFNYRGENALAHVLSYLIHCGPIPFGQVVRHKCDNPPCIRPDHLELGTHQDNQNDKAERNRGNKTRIPEGTIRSIQVNPYNLSQSQLGLQFGLRQSLISKIQNRTRKSYRLKEE